MHSDAHTPMHVDTHISVSFGRAAHGHLRTALILIVPHSLTGDAPRACWCWTGPGFARLLAAHRTTGMARPAGCTTRPVEFPGAMMCYHNPLYSPVAHTRSTCMDDCSYQQRQ